MDLRRVAPVLVLLLLFGGRRGPRTPSTQRLSRADLEALARGAGFPESEVAHAATIALRESGGNPRAVNDTRKGPLPRGHRREFSKGLWQINVLAHPRYANVDLFDPARNARAAHDIWRVGGWSLWSTHKE